MGTSRYNRRRFLLGAAVALAAGQVAASGCVADRVTISGDFGKAAFNVDLAADDSSRAQGLMHVQQMPASKGMLFVYERPQPMSFWMRNTLIELDMLFLDGFGVIQHIHHRAKPLDETVISSGPQLLLGVLEINGGLARRMGIKTGDIVRHPAFISRENPWECGETGE